MKKTLIVLAMLTGATVASAADVTVSGVRDANLDRDGTRVTVSTNRTVGPVTPFASVTHINDRYTRYAVGGTVPVTTLGPVAVRAAVGGVYQDTAGRSADGYGLTAGLQAGVNLTKTVQLTAGVERFIGQNRVDQFNGNVATVGLNVKF